MTQLPKVDRRGSVDFFFFFAFVYSFTVFRLLWT